MSSANVPQVPEVPQGSVRNLNSQCADLEDWDSNAFPLMIERSNPADGVENPFTTLTLESADTVVALLTKQLKLVTERRVIICPPVVQDHPDLAPLVEWLKAATASQRSRRNARAE